MKFEIIIVSPPDNPHCAAFIEVAETLKWGLEALGHDADLRRSPPTGQGRAIVFGAHLLAEAGWQLPADAVLYNLEQVGDNSPVVSPALVDLYRRHMVWDYSQSNLQRLAAKGLSRLDHVPIGYAPVLKKVPAADKDIDVLLYGSINDRRRAILETMMASGLKVMGVFNVYGQERDALIARARIVLNVHYYDAKVLEVVRLSYLLANGCAVVSEPGASQAERDEFSGGIAFSHYDDLLETCRGLLQDDAARAQLAQKGMAVMQARSIDGILKGPVSRLQNDQVQSAPHGQAEAAADPPAYYQCARPEVVQVVAPKGKRILDVGCAAGAMGNAMLQGGAEEVVGLELAADALRLARTRLSAAYRLDLNGACDLPYPEGYFDCITFADVLEHLMDPGKTLRSLRRYLAPGGRIVVSLPNVRHESVVLPLLVNGQWDYQDAGILDRTHLRFFTQQSMMAFMRQSGFDPEGNVFAVRSPPSQFVDRFAQLVAEFGGDAQRYREECTTIQYVFAARPHDQGVAARPGRVPNLWRGSAPARFLVAPHPAHMKNGWSQSLGELAKKMAGRKDTSVAIAMAKESLQAPPKELEALAAQHPDTDLALLEAPTDQAGWQRLLAGATAFLPTTGRDDLSALAEKVGTEIATL